MVRRVSFFLFLPPASSATGDAPPPLKKPPPFLPPGGASIFVSESPGDYFLAEGHHLKMFDGIAATASIFPLTGYGITVVKVDNDKAFLAETSEALAKVVDCHHDCSFRS